MDIDEGASLASATHRMAWQGCRHLPVMRRGRLVGVLSERDVLSWQASGRSLDGPDDFVGAAMSSPAIVTGPDDDLAEASARMLGAHIGCLPVVSNDNLVGMLTSTDLVGHLAARKLRPAADLTLLAADLMTSRVFTVAPDDLISEAANVMASNRVRQLPVVDDGGRLVGIVTEHDVRNTLGVPAGVDRDAAAKDNRPVREVMTKSVECVRPDQPLLEVIAAMLSRNVCALPVLNTDRRPLGIVSYLDVLRALCR
jgi:acetoin utilization protein AcuB